MTMPNIDLIIRYEQGELTTAEVLDLFANLIKTGLAWSLQGSYGRAAVALVEGGLITPDGEITDRGRTEAEEN